MGLVPWLSWALAALVNANPAAKTETARATPRSVLWLIGSTPSAETFLPAIAGYSRLQALTHVKGGKIDESGGAFEGNLELRQCAAFAFPLGFQWEAWATRNFPDAAGIARWLWNARRISTSGTS